MLLCRLEELCAVVEGLDQVQARDLRAAEQTQQASPALLEEQWPKIVSVTVQEVEGEEHELVLLCLTRCEPEPVEVRSAIRVWQDELAVKQSGAAPERQEDRCQAGEPIGPLDATAAVEAHLAAVLDDLEAVAVKLELVQPGFSDRRLLGRGRDTGTNEARG